MKLVVGLFFCFSLAVGQQHQNQNVVFIAVDDLKPTIRSFGDDYAITPNMDFLARKSSLFLNNHTQQAICSPSRISLLTGLRPDRTMVYDLRTKMRDKTPTWLLCLNTLNLLDTLQQELEKYLIQGE
jgi:hypothetical protein